jgi:hypothetical protein
VLRPVLLHFVIERLVDLIGVEKHQVGVAQRAFLGFAKKKRRRPKSAPLASPDAKTLLA